MSLSRACSVCARVGSKSPTNAFRGRKRASERQVTAPAVQDAPTSIPFTGEWVGLSASFSPKGTAIQVPDTHVPREYAEWGIEIKDWASVSSLNVKGAEHAALLLLTKFMLPTVGCEADASSFVEDKRVYSSNASHTSAAAASFSHSGHVGILHTSSTQEHFIGYPETLPDSGKAVLDFSVLVYVGFRSRVRLHLNKWSEGSPWSLQKIDLFREEYSGVYTGGRELPMSCGAEPGFSRDDVPDNQSIRALRAASSSQDVLQTAWGWHEGDELVHLPLGVSLRVTVAEEAFRAEVMVLPDVASDASKGGDESARIGSRGAVLAQVEYEAGSATSAGIEEAPAPKHE